MDKKLKVQGRGFRMWVRDSGSRVHSCGFRMQVRGEGSRVHSCGFRMQVRGSGSRDQGSHVSEGLWVQGPGFTCE